jgi:DNA-binding transcriptional regulator YiaG
MTVLWRKRRPLPFLTPLGLFRRRFAAQCKSKDLVQDPVAWAIGHGCTSIIELMPNIASILKSEIGRVARKEIRAEVESLKKASAAYRGEIAALKRRTDSLERELRRVGKAMPPTEPRISEIPTKPVRFSPKRLAAHRKRLGLSAEDLGLLLNASSQSVYNWEEGKVRPRNGHLPAIAALRTLSRKQVMSVLAALRSAQ